MLITSRSSKANISVFQLKPIQKHSQEHVHINSPMLLIDWKKS